MTNVVEVKIEATGDITERHKIMKKIREFMIGEGYWIASEGSGRGKSDALFHPKGTRLT